MTAYNRNTLIGGLLAAVLVGGVLSYFKSENPDGLEKTQAVLAAQNPGGTEKAPESSPAAEPEAVTEQTLAPLFDDYKLTLLGHGFLANAAGGVLGSLGVMGLLLGVGFLLRRARLAREKAASSSAGQ
jgi:PDGLE domain